VIGSGMRDSQLAMARYLRNPEAESPPAGSEQRRMAIYQRLVYNNIESFISSGFPVLRSLYNDEDWHALVRSFIVQHRCQTPYFLEISQEFIQFLMTEYQPGERDPPFLSELAHYEWVELALDVAEAEPPGPGVPADVLAAVPQLSALAWLLSYHYPVHHIGPGFRPEQPGEPTYLVVYRDRQERVQFMVLNAFTARLVELTRDNTTATGRELLKTLADESGMALSGLLDAGAGQLEELYEVGVLGPPAGSAESH
jgi:hypothetical protein